MDSKLSVDDVFYLSLLCGIMVESTSKSVAERTNEERELSSIEFALDCDRLSCRARIDS